MFLNVAMSVVCGCHLFNPCAAGTVLYNYIIIILYGFKHVLDQYKYIIKFDKIVFGRCSVNPLTQYRRCLFFLNPLSPHDALKHHLAFSEK